MNTDGNDTYFVRAPEGELTFQDWTRLVHYLEGVRNTDPNFASITLFRQTPGGSELVNPRDLLPMFM